VRKQVGYLVPVANKNIYASIFVNSNSRKNHLARFRRITPSDCTVLYILLSSNRIQRMGCHKFTPTSFVSRLIFWPGNTMQHSCKYCSGDIVDGLLPIQCKFVPIVTNGFFLCTDYEIVEFFHKSNSAPLESPQYSLS
jgi:hypothetical protein